MRYPGECKGVQAAVEIPERAVRIVALATGILPGIIPDGYDRIVSPGSIRRSGRLPKEDDDPCAADVFRTTYWSVLSARGTMRHTRWGRLNRLSGSWETADFSVSAGMFFPQMQRSRLIRPMRKR